VAGGKHSRERGGSGVSWGGIDTVPKSPEGVERNPCFGGGRGREQGTWFFFHCKWPERGKERKETTGSQRAQAEWLGFREEW